MASKEFIAKVKKGVDIVEVIGESIALKRSGKYWMGLSPFNKEKSPSFFVNQEQQSYYCFSSNQGGDAISFLEKTKGLTFAEALKVLADKAGLPFEHSNQNPTELAAERKREEDRKMLLLLNQHAARFYQDQIVGPQGGIAREYIKKRMISADMQLRFAIGYAPDSWTALRDHFIKIQAPLLRAHDLGLFRTKGGEKPKADGSNLFDTFRNRLMFPIFEPAGGVVGFGGRWLGANSPETPKYINSPESVIYEKEKTLYNLGEARKSARETEAMILVEGYMDCLTLVQFGFENVVANCGTALTKNQTMILSKSAPRVICLYDSDDAGQAASERAMNLFLEFSGTPMLAAKVPHGKDPDEFLHSSPMARVEMAKALQDAPAALDQWIEGLIAATPATIQAKTEALEKIASKLARLSEELWIVARAQDICKKLELPLSLMERALKKYQRNVTLGAMGSMPESGQVKATQREFLSPEEYWQKNSKVLEKNKQIAAADGKRTGGLEKKFLLGLLRNPTWITRLRENSKGDPKSITSLLLSSELQKVLEFLLVPLSAGETEEIRIKNTNTEFRENEKLRNFLAESSMGDSGSTHEEKLDEYLTALKAGKYKRDSENLAKQISEAEKTGDSENSDLMLQRLLEIRKSRAERRQKI